MATQVSLTDGAVASAGALAIQTNGTTQAVSISTGQVATLAQNPILTSGTANGVAYLNGSKAVTSGSALVFDGTNLGVGVTPVGLDSRFKNLEVGPTASLSSILVSSTSLLTYLQHNSYVDSSGATKFKYTGGSNYASQYNQNNGSHLWQTSTAAGTGGNACTFTTNMTLDASGRLGIGTTSPSRLLHVQATGTGNVATFQSNAGPNLAFVGTESSGRTYLIGEGLVTAGNFSIYDSTGSAERLVIDSSGNLLVGTTSTTPTSGGFVALPAGGQSYTLTGHVTGTGGGATYAAYMYNGSIIGSITQNGTTGVLYNLTSDYRLKNNPVPVTGAKEFIMALQPKKWQWWDGSGEGVGFIAHEFMEVAKYSGHGEKDAVNEDGNPVYQSIQPSSSEVMANLVSLIQEQQALITQLQADVAALKGA